LQYAISEIGEMNSSPLGRTTGILKALAHPARLRVLAMLRSGGLCVCQVAAAMGAPVSTVSEHLGELKRAGLLLERREGRWVSYSLADEASALLDHIWDLIGSDPLVRQEERLVRRLRRLPVAALCDAGLDLARFGLKPAS
jgi:ArsR family transcriptional regulator, arsenate/arsenite/antimonite-responsive transcriptional repressor